DVVGHRLAVGLVGGIDVAAKRRLGAIEGTDEVVGGEATQKEQIAREAKEGVGGQPGRAGHAANGMKDLEDEPMRIDQIERLRSSARRHDDASPGGPTDGHGPWPWRRGRRPY